jgi:zinc protease
LENGLRVIVIENPVVPLVTIEMDVKNGAYTESPEYSGLSHLYEHMFFKANSNIPNQEKYLERLAEIGALWNGTTSDERVNYYFTLPRDSLEAGLEFMFYAISAPLFLDEELKKERPVVIGEIDRNESNPYFNLFRAVDEKVWWKYFSRKDVLGPRQVILSTTPEKMRTIQQRYYIPNNSALIIAGDIKADRGFTLAEKYFASWEGGPNPFDMYQVPIHPPIQKNETIIIEQNVNVVTIYMMWQGPSVGKDPQATYAADVLSFITGQQTSQFQKNLVESGLAFNANLSYYTLNHTGPISILVQTSAENYQICLSAIYKEIEAMTRPDYFTAAQLQNAKTILAINEQYSREKPSEFIHTIGFWWAVASLDYYLKYIDNLNQVTHEDISRYLRTYVTGKAHITGVMVAPGQRESMGL